MTGLVLLLGLRALASCSAYAEADPSPSGADAAATNDGGAAEAGDASGESGAANILENADFALGCAGWKVFGNAGSRDGVIAQKDSVGRTAGPSCLVCRTSNYGGLLGLEQAVPRALAVGNRLNGTIWAQAVPDAGVPEKLTISVATRDAPGAFLTERASEGANIAPTTTEWKEALQFVVVSRQDGFAVLTIETDLPSGNACFRVDDATLTVLPP